MFASLPSEYRHSGKKNPCGQKAEGDGKALYILPLPSGCHGSGLVFVVQYFILGALHIGHTVPTYQKSVRIDAEGCAGHKCAVVLLRINGKRAEIIR